MAENLKRLDGESMFDWEKRAAAQFPGQWIVLDDEEVLFHSSDSDEALKRYHTIAPGKKYPPSIMTPDYAPVREGVLRARN